MFKMIYHVETLSDDVMFGPPCTDTSSSFKIKVVKITAIPYRMINYVAVLFIESVVTCFLDRK